MVGSIRTLFIKAKKVEIGTIAEPKERLSLLVHINAKQLGLSGRQIRKVIDYVDQNTTGIYDWQAVRGLNEKQQQGMWGLDSYATSNTHKVYTYQSYTPRWWAWLLLGLVVAVVVAGICLLV